MEKRIFPVSIEHSGNKNIRQSGTFQNEIGPGVRQSRVQQARTLEECKMHKAYTTDHTSILPLLSEILARYIVLSAWLDHSRSNSFSKYPIILFSGCSIALRFGQYRGAKCQYDEGTILINLFTSMALCCTRCKDGRYIWSTSKTSLFIFLYPLRVFLLDQF